MLNISLMMGSRLLAHPWIYVMPHECSMCRVDKLTKLIAVFDQFHTMALRDNPLAKQLAGNWSDIRDRYVRPEGVSRSALAA